MRLTEGAPRPPGLESLTLLPLRAPSDSPAAAVLVLLGRSDVAEAAAAGRGSMLHVPGLAAAAAAAATALSGGRKAGSGAF